MPEISDRTKQYSQDTIMAAMELYQTDAKFHYRVDLAVNLVKLLHGEFDDRQLTVAQTCTMVGLYLSTVEGDVFMKEIVRTEREFEASLYTPKQFKDL